MAAYFDIIRIIKTFDFYSGKKLNNMKFVNCYHAFSVATTTTVASVTATTENTLTCVCTFNC